MVENKLNKTNYKASFLVPDFIEIQRRGFSQFLEKGIAEELSKINPIRSDISKTTLTFYPEKFLLISPDYTITDAILQGKTYSCKLYLPATLLVKDSAFPAGRGKPVHNKTTKKKQSEGKAHNLDIAPKATKSPALLLQRASTDRISPDWLTKHEDTPSQLLLHKKQKDLPKGPALHATAPLSLQATRQVEQLWHLRSMIASKPLITKRLQKPRQGEKEFSSRRATAFARNLRFGETRSVITRGQPYTKIEGVKIASSFSWVLIGSIPLMTKRGHFVINGSPRVVVNQLVRSPGVYFHERRWGNGKKKKRVVYADFVSRRGAWLRIQVDKEGNAWARLKKTPKIPFPLFFDAMAACERNPKSWTTADREALLELHEEVTTTQRDSSVENGSQFILQRFKNPRIYDLGPLGRSRLNRKFGISAQTQQLTSQDLYSAFQQLQELQNDHILPDDIDHLKNRRVRASGELVQGQFEVGVYRLEKAILGKMRKPTTDLTPRSLANTKPLNAAFREFFGSSPLSQYMDQTNPLAEITQKRRISSLGPGGINRETAGMAIRGIHPTHYGRICPIETPEGKNAGLVNSLTAYTRIGPNGILETPYYSVAHGQVQRRGGLRYLSATEEERKGSKVAPGDVRSSVSLLLPATSFPIREMGDPQEDFKHMERTKVNYIAISPIQMISVATALIPFLEHDDANRALMGSNMQRQAVPLLRPERPVVGTGLEALVIAESGHAVQSKASGYVSFVSASTISICSTQPWNWGHSDERRLERRPQALRNVSKDRVLLSWSTALRSHNSLLSHAWTTRLCQGLRSIHYPSLMNGQQAYLGRRPPWGAADLSCKSQFVQQVASLNWQVFAILRGRLSYQQGHRKQVSFVAAKTSLSSAVWRGGVDGSFGSHLIKLVPCQAGSKANLKGVGLGVLGCDWPSRRQLCSQWHKAFSAVEVEVDLTSALNLQGDFLQKGIKHFLLKAARFKGGGRPSAWQGSCGTFGFGSVVKTPARCFENSKKPVNVEIEKWWSSSAWRDLVSAAKQPAIKGKASQYLPPRKPVTVVELPVSTAATGCTEVRVTGALLGPWDVKIEDQRRLPVSAEKALCGVQSLRGSYFNYPLQSYHRSNQETCLTQMPAVCEGDWVQRGDLLADCSASRFGELALGKNILIAYLPWEGYNFEDAVVISERLVSDDVYTSVHIQKYEIEIRETRFGFEKITHQVPGVTDSQKTHLNRQGIAKLGTLVREGDILVGKVGPRSSHPLSPYERLAYDIANVEAARTEDTSLRVPKGVEGRVINCQVFKAANIPLEQQTSGPGRVRVYLAEKRKIQIGDKVAGRHGNKGIVSKILPRQDMPYLPNGGAIDMVLNPLGIPSRMNVGQVFECLLGLASIQLGQAFKVTPFDEIYGAEASRSLVYLKLYQARLRTHQDWLFNLSFPGKSALFDGRTGYPFDQWVTAGNAYMLKLVHLVDEKIHARSTGPYSLVTKQPLGGRSKHGGQRLGEMEVWALEGFGAAYTLQEMLTSKSDDIVGREQVIEAILFKGRMSLGNPEAFKVLVRELQSLCLDVGVYAISPDRLQREAVDIGCIP